MPKKRRSSRRGGSATISGLIILIIIAVYYFLTGNNGGVPGLGTPLAGLPTNTAIVNLPTSENVSGSWWEVYFTDPINIKNHEDWQGSIEGRLIDKIHAALSSIHIASFECDLAPVAEALIAAKQRGVDVRWVTDDENGLGADEEPGHGQFAMLKNAGIEVRSDNRSALMHNKFWIFDNQFVWTGSTNITENGIFK